MLTTHRSIQGELRAIPPDSDLCPMDYVEIIECDPLPVMWKVAANRLRFGMAVLPALVNKGTM